MSAYKTVTTPAGTHRFQVQCRYCKARWQEEAHSYYELATAHHCHGMDTWRQIARVGSTPFGCTRIVASEVRHRRTATPHKCSAKCLGAHGPDCECQCGGLNHGAGHLVGVA